MKVHCLNVPLGTFLLLLLCVGLMFIAVAIAVAVVDAFDH